MRGFEIANGYNNKHVRIPKRSTPGSAGYDLETIESITIEPGAIVRAPTGLKAYMQNDEVLKLYPRSSLPVKFGVTILNNVGIIDADYYSNPDNDGAIFVQLFNFTDKTCYIPARTRIAQGIFVKYLTTDADEVATNQRSGGFGSTG